ncbi:MULTISPECIES: DUF1090 family protein [Burkholderia]|uniref:DUF1090 domain-containing protein n=1 Tax=Burkholderia contaminans TaxID=488447 RepID=A0A2S5DYB9_9BURK|nr:MULTISPECIES: DUF1090 family protein [Burkholderia]EKS9797227.1 DUF1090 family protein [Burkholderia cepacia]EKS9807135.1 DUF1090 family protein [Burkholderia cepacia]EKS9809468.1 DUF1090 family protein [Burkholderia cepacia]EKS9819201.1 DUF1090 family protein [Burkholderia cepacia]EKS9826925.1 DUF1090 family protein [Burkholderia cepacia]
MMNQRLTPFLAAALLAAAAPAVAAQADCAAKLDALDTRIAEARTAHAEDRVARLRAVRERVRHFCARGHGHASAVHVPAPDARSTGTPSGGATSQSDAKQPA